MAAVDIESSISPINSHLKVQEHKQQIAKILTEKLYTAWNRAGDPWNRSRML